ncbi:MAG: hypothetical protein GY816_20110 [Cytophagales bacterium]|nr:hypothetical protein [Cytophagales bacterium]
MNRLFFNFYAIWFLLMIAVLSCETKPKEILADDEPVPVEVNEFSSNSDSQQSGKAVSGSSENTRTHYATVKEVLPSSKYVYLFVEESGEEFWIATFKQEIEIGESFSYSGELLKTNFESKEHNRTFEKIYLVSKIIKTEFDQTNTNTVEQAETTIETETEIAQQEGSIKIADLVKDPSKFDGKTIQLSGVCTKVNVNIMNRNWLHLKDGSKDDYDLVITTDFLVPVGHEITIKGTVVVGKDFGSGYYYEILVENGELVSEEK